MKPHICRRDRMCLAGVPYELHVWCCFGGGVLGYADNMAGAYAMWARRYEKQRAWKNAA